MQIKSAYLSIAKILATLTVMLFSFSSVGQSSSEVFLILSRTDSLKVHVTVHNLSGTKAFISLLDQNRNTIYRENFKSETYVRAFDISQLEDGEYVFEVYAGKEIERRSLIINTRLEETRSLIIQKPRIKNLRFF